MTQERRKFGELAGSLLTGFQSFQLVNCSNFSLSNSYAPLDNQDRSIVSKISIVRIDGFAVEIQSIQTDANSSAVPANPN